MKSCMKKLILTLLLSLAPAFAEDVTGKWTFDTNFLGSRDTVECTFRQSSTKLSGSCKGEQFPESNAMGKVNEGNVQFSFVYLFAGQSYNCSYQGKLNGDTELAGSIVITGIDGVTGEFKAKKQQPGK